MVYPEFVVVFSVYFFLLLVFFSLSLIDPLRNESNIERSAMPYFKLSHLSIDLLLQLIRVYRSYTRDNKFSFALVPVILYMYIFYIRVYIHILERNILRIFTLLTQIILTRTFNIYHKTIINQSHNPR